MLEELEWLFGMHLVILMYAFACRFEEGQGFYHEV